MSSANVKTFFCSSNPESVRLVFFLNVALRMKSIALGYQAISEFAFARGQGLFGILWFR